MMNVTDILSGRVTSTLARVTMTAMGRETYAMTTMTGRRGAHPVTCRFEPLDAAQNQEKLHLCGDNAHRQGKMLSVLCDSLAGFNG